MRLTILAVALLALAALSGCGDDAMKQLYDEGHGAVLLGKYEDGAAKLEQFLQRAGSRYRGKSAHARLLLGRAYFALGQYPRAEEAFKNCMQSTAGTETAHRCQFRLALLALYQNDKAAALQHAQALRSTTLAPEGDAMIRFLNAQP